MGKSIFYRFHKKSSWGFLRPLLKLVLWLFICGVVFGLAAFLYFAKDLPNPDNINERQITQSTKIYDRTGKVLLYDIHGEEKRTIVNIDQISDYLKKATIATEDANFYNHFGLDFKGIARAALGVITRNRSAGGGSTITQQFIKNSILTNEYSLTRKIKEAVLALELERRYGKDEILALYLNQVPYGSNAYGIEAASQTFFNKSAKDLSLVESALLAALPQSPSRLSPYGSHPEELKARQEYVLDRMVKTGYIAQEEAAAAKKEPLNFSTAPHGIKAPHFVMYIKEYIENKYGQDAVEKQGLKVYTTLDWDLQQAAEQIISDGAKSNWKKYGARNAALTAIDPKTGQILTMVGSYDYFDTAHDGNVNVTIRDRQPGSSFKPFAYATAFKKGYTADTVLFDVPTEFNPNCPADASQEKDQYGLDCYHPGNYDDKFRGPLTAREALAQSLNIPSVEILYLAGIEDTIKTAKAMGITSLNDNYYGLSLVLGGGEVKLLDEVAAYGVFAADGTKNEKTAILNIEDKDGNILEEYKPQPEKVLEPQTTRLISDVLSDNNARTPVFGANSALYFPDRPVAAKTGTTQKYRDAWTLGYTPSLVVGVWVGNNNNDPMSRAGAGLAAAGPLWHDFIKKAYKLKTNCDNSTANAFCLPKNIEQFIKPDPIQTNKSMLNGSYLSAQTIKIDKISGALATDQTPPDIVEEKTITGAHSVLYYVQKDNPQGDAPTSPANDEQYKNWEAAAQRWLVSHGLNIASQTIPSQNNSRSPVNLPKINMIAPVNYQTITQSKIFIQADVAAPLGARQVDFFLNDNFIGSTMSAPYQINALIQDNIPNGQATISARVYDQAFNRQEAKAIVYINR
ncbi:MAG: PBP1A family penicillin-binding protein [Candidatus Portnoybacteria bacterium]|nr:PBP1A family penicillin-binding protein [Candidatus Portnoybacteria bacterium]MDD4982708.1 PBP1A family penicillin-binding protein [Candidatus Portnoybacteria bacterium]